MKRIFYLLSFLLGSFISLGAQDVQIDSIAVTAPSCPGSEDGSITIFATSPGNITFSLDSVNFQSSNEFTVSAGTFTVSVGDSINFVSQNVVVGEGIDTIAPSITCPPALTLPLDADCRITVPELRDQAIATDNCTPDDSIMIFQSPPPPVTVGTGVMDVEFELFAMDQSGNFTSCIIMVSPVDETAPTLECPASVLIALDDNCGLTVPDLTDSITVIDNCFPDDMVMFSQSLAIGEMLDTNSAMITLTVTDGSGNVSTCDIVVNATDQTTPSLTCPDSFEIFLDGDCRIEAPELRDMVKVTDNCSAVEDIMLFQSPTPPANIGTGVGTVVFQIFAMDEARNFTNCDILVTTVDTIAPVIECPANVVVELGEDCTAGLPDFSQFITITDNCTDAETAGFTQSIAVGTPTEVGSFSISLLVEDESGNATGCDISFTVEDLTAPVAVCRDFTLELGEDGKATLSPKDIDAGSSDNCAVDFINIDNKTFDCGDVGENIVTLTVKDDNANRDECRAKVLVVDDVAPIVTCKNITVELDENSGTVSIDVNDVEVSSSDACGIHSSELSKSEFDCDDLGKNKVHLKVMDNSWNKTSCELEVMVREPDDLPNLFSTVSIGQSRGASSFSVCDDKFTLESVKVGVGPLFNLPQDFNQFTYISINGDFFFEGRVAEKDSRLVAGLMIRAGTSDNAPFAYAGINNDRGTVTETGFRSAMGGSNNTSQQRFGGSNFSIRRSGNTVTIRNGGTVVLEQNIDLGSSAVVGFFVTSRWRNEVMARFESPNFAQFLTTRPDSNTGSGTLSGTISAYPNPATNMVTVEMGDFYDQDATLRLINAAGQEVLVQQYDRIDESRIQVDVSQFSQGLYFLSIATREKRAQVKLIIE